MVVRATGVPVPSAAKVVRNSSFGTRRVPNDDLRVTLGEAGTGTPVMLTTKPEARVK